MSERNLAIFNDYKEMGVMQLVGNKYGITRERVRQIVSRFGYKKPKKVVLTKEEKQAIRYDKFVALFWSHISKTETGCWEWTLSRLPYGYGRVAFLGNKNQYAHRVAWILTHGDIPDGLCVCHKCDNPPCINPDHLFIGTYADNAHDRDAKGRNRWEKKKTHA